MNDERSTHRPSGHEISTLRWQAGGIRDAHITAATIRGWCRIVSSPPQTGRSSRIPNELGRGWRTWLPGFRSRGATRPRRRAACRHRALPAADGAQHPGVAARLIDRPFQPQGGRGRFQTEFVRRRPKAYELLSYFAEPSWHGWVDGKFTCAPMLLHHQTNMQKLAEIVRAWNANSLLEFGCGSGINLALLRKACELPSAVELWDSNIRSTACSPRAPRSRRSTSTSRICSARTA